MADGPNIPLGASVQRPVGEGLRSVYVLAQTPYPPTEERNVLDSPRRPEFAVQQNVQLVRATGARIGYNYLV